MAETLSIRYPCGSYSSMKSILDGMSTIRASAIMDETLVASYRAPLRSEKPWMTPLAECR